MNIFSKFIKSLKKTKEYIANLVSGIFKREFDEDFFEEFEMALVSCDFGSEASSEIIEILKTEIKKNKIKTKDAFYVKLREILQNILNDTVKDDELDNKPLLITVVGVNGVGKTTALGKLAYYYKKKGNKVLLVAADTFRAAASEQLTEWSKKAGVRIVKYEQGADPGAVVYDGVASAIAKKDDIVLVDTAGRLHNKTNLMEELKKINRIITTQWQERTAKNYLVIDATIGQNSLTQLEIFNEAIKIDGIILTKLDGTSKGGIIFAIAKQYKIPVKFVGVGESINDIVEFNAKDFVETIF